MSNVPHSYYRPLDIPINRYSPDPFPEQFEIETLKLLTLFWNKILKKCSSVTLGKNTFGIKPLSGGIICRKTGFCSERALNSTRLTASKLVYSQGAFACLSQTERITNDVMFSCSFVFLLSNSPVSVLVQKELRDTEWRATAIYVFQACLYSDNNCR